MQIPNNLEEALDILESNLDQDSREIVKTGAKGQLHFGAGMEIRNAWGLWYDKTPISKWFIEQGVHHADDKSACLFDALKARLTGKFFDINKEAKYYRRYWEESAKRENDDKEYNFKINGEGRVEFVD